MYRSCLLVISWFLVFHIYAEIADNSVTIVSAFLAINNKNRSVYDYVDHSEYLLKSDIPKVIFIDSFIYDCYYKKKYFEGVYPKTVFIPIDQNSLWLRSYEGLIQNFNVVGNPNKDTLDYMFVICNKTEWVAQAIALNIFNTDQFVWVDFGLFHIFKDPKLFDYELKELQKKSYDVVRIGGCWSFEYEPEKRNIDIYRNVAWYFAGGVFGGNKESLKQFNKLVKEKCKEVIFQKNSIMWEVNIWYLVYLENKELFNIYSCGHNYSLLSNY